MVVLEGFIAKEPAACSTGLYQYVYLIQTPPPPSRPPFPYPRPHPIQQATLHHPSQEGHDCRRSGAVTHEISPDLHDPSDTARPHNSQAHAPAALSRAKTSRARGPENRPRSHRDAAASASRIGKGDVGLTRGGRDRGAGGRVGAARVSRAANPIIGNSRWLHAVPPAAVGKGKLLAGWEENVVPAAAATTPGCFAWFGFASVNGLLGFRFRRGLRVGKRWLQGWVGPLHCTPFPLRPRGGGVTAGD